MAASNFSNCSVWATQSMKKLKSTLLGADPCWDNGTSKLLEFKVKLDLLVFEKLKTELYVSIQV